MWNSKFMAWVEQKMIDLTSMLYIKRREVTPPVVEQTTPTMEPTPVAPAETVSKKRTFVKRTEPKLTKAAPTKKVAIKAPKPAVKKPAATKKVAKPAAKATTKKPAATTKTRKAAK